MKLFLAGAESLDIFEAGKLSGHKNFLFSNYHRGNIDMKLVEGLEVIMDSGLFTMMFGSGKGKDYSKEYLIEYTHKYIKDMKDMGRPGAIVEMDVHKVLGVEHLQDFRDIFERDRPLEKTIYVFHVEEGVDGLKKLAKKYPYIALSIPELRIVYGDNIEHVMIQLLKIIKQVNPQCKVHLLGCTQVNLLKNPYYYSCDSSSWLSSSRYGGLTVFKDGRLSKKKVTNKNLDIKKMMGDIGINLDFSHKDYHNIQTREAIQYNYMQKYINARFYPYSNHN